MKMAHVPSALPRYLAFAFTGLILYASLHPLTGIRSPALSPLLFLTAAWPRYWTWFDLIVNVLAYVPLGFLVALSLRPPLWPWCASLLAILFGGALSFGVEVVQAWLPSRVSSNLDLGCNTLGAVVGSVLAWVYGERFFLRMALVQHRLLAPRPHAELGLLLAGLWLLTQLSPETLLFGAGDLRHLLPLFAVIPYAPTSFPLLEAAIVACNMLAIAMLMRELLADRPLPHVVLGVFFLIALAVRALAAAVLIDPMSALAWATQGARLGLEVGAVAVAVLLFLPSGGRVAIGALALMAGTVLVNITPVNPYSEIALAMWRQGHFLNFNGLTRLSAMLWPFVALPYLMVLNRKSPPARK